MQEVYLLNPGDTVSKVKFEYPNCCGVVGLDTIENKKYMILKDGSSDIRLIRNYLPMYLYKVKSGENTIDIFSRGFEILGGEAKKEGDILLIHKPKSIRYVVSPLETLDNIAEKYGVSKYDIMSGNNLVTDKLFVGQIIWI